MNNNFSEESHLCSPNSEPADPSNVVADHEARRNTRLYSSTNPDICKYLIECGCGNCPNFCSPLYEEDIEGREDYFSKEYCDSARSMTVDQAREAYVTYERKLENRPDRTAVHERARYKRYPQILNADRYFRTHYDELTTVMFTRRVSPMDSKNNWLHPSQLDLMINSALLLKKVRKAVQYKLRHFDFNYMRLTAVTESAATPHEHRYFWIEDPDNEIDVKHFTSALQKHIDMWANAKKKHHPYDADGDEGAITVQHEPSLVDEEPDKMQEVRHGSKQFEDVDSFLRNTQGAQYIASQLPHMEMWNKFDHDADTKDTLLEGGAIAKATSSRWFGTSNEVPDLSE